MTSLADKLRAAADRIDPETDGVVILLVGGAEIMLGITATGNTPFDVQRLVTALDDAVHQPSYRTGS